MNGLEVSAKVAHSIAVLTSEGVTLPQTAKQIFDELPCSVTVCTPDNAFEVLPQADALLVWDTDQHAFMEQHWGAFDHLRWIHVAVTGVDSFMFPALKDSAVTVTNAAGIYNDSIAEFVAYAVLSSAKRARLLNAQQSSRRWRHIYSETVRGTHAVVYGVGSIGRTVGAMLHALGMQVRGVDPGTAVAEGFDFIYPVSDLVEAARWADHFIICAPLTDSTRHSIGEKIFSVMRPTCHVINVGRGPIIDEQALIEALAAGQIGSASLDVFEHEPLDSASPLWSMPNVSISPHISGDAGDFEMALLRQFVNLAKRWLAGNQFLLVVDKQKGYAVRQA